MTRYMGGKGRTARYLIPVLQREAPPNAQWWEPFMGGGNMTGSLATVWPGGLASDFHSACGAMWSAAVDGWDPPAVVSEADHKAARTLPDTDPQKFFTLAFCSFGGKYGGGYARSAQCRDYAGGAMRSVRKISATLRAQRWRVVPHSVDFFSVPTCAGWHLYCDPLYAGTQDYGRAFDSAAFWARCQDWARAGSRVFVSEYQIPPQIPHRVLWSGQRTQGLRHTTGAARRTEILFEVLP